MPDILEPYHTDEPLSPNPDRPWITLGTDQLHRIVELVGEHHGSIRLEYGGAGYWFVRLLDAENHRGEGQVVWPIEPHHGDPS